MPTSQLKPKFYGPTPPRIKFQTMLFFWSMSKFYELMPTMRLSTLVINTTTKDAGTISAAYNRFCGVVDSDEKCVAFIGVILHW